MARATDLHFAIRLFHDREPSVQYSFPNGNDPPDIHTGQSIVAGSNIITGASGWTSDILGGERIQAAYGRDGTLGSNDDDNSGWYRAFPRQGCYVGAVRDTFVIVVDAYVNQTGVASIIASSTLNKTAHGFVAGDTVVLAGVSTTTGIVNDTEYFVSATGLTANAFRLAATSGGTPITFGGTADAAITVSGGAPIDAGYSYNNASPPADVGAHALNVRTWNYATVNPHPVNNCMLRYGAWCGYAKSGPNHDGDGHILWQQQNFTSFNLKAITDDLPNGVGEVDSAIVPGNTLFFDDRDIADDIAGFGLGYLSKKRWGNFIAATSCSVVDAGTQGYFGA